MNTSFDEWMREQFPDGEPPELAAEICKLCERHGVPLLGVKIVLEELMTVVTAVSKLRQLTRQCEFEGIARDRALPRNCSRSCSVGSKRTWKFDVCR